MATNTPTQPPEVPNILVRGSEEYKEYMRQGGRLTAFVNGLEKRLATSGRTLLLIFIIYATIQGTLLIGGVHVPFLLDVVMLSFQVAGLEGSIPGLTRLREEMLTQRREEDAKEIFSTIKSSRVLNLLTGVEIVLGTHPTIGSFSTTDLASWYAGILLLLRLYYITKFLGTMSRMESHGPRIISQAEHDRLQAEQEQEQVRLDNVAIQGQIDQALTRWTTEQECQFDNLIARISANFQTQIDETLAPIQAAQSSQTIDTQILIQAVADVLVPQFQARIQAVDQALLRQNTTIAELVNQAKHLPEKASSGNVQANNSGSPLPEKRQLRQPVQAENPAHQAEDKVIRLVPANTTREQMIAEAKRLQAAGLSTYQIGEKLGKSPKTVQSWFAGKSGQTEGEAINE